MLHLQPKCMTVTSTTKSHTSKHTSNHSRRFKARQKATKNHSHKDMQVSQQDRGSPHPFLRLRVPLFPSFLSFPGFASGSRSTSKLIRRSTHSRGCHRRRAKDASAKPFHETLRALLCKVTGWKSDRKNPKSSLLIVSSFPNAWRHQRPQLLGLRPALRDLPPLLCPMSQMLNEILS
eukprot:SAG31_NODE_4711_length_3016_cov_5.967089_4_plen_177_part_00